MKKFDENSKGKNIEELFEEIEQTNNNYNSKKNIIKDIFIQIKNEYKLKYEGININRGKQEAFFTNKVKEILKKKENKNSFYISLIPLLIKASSLVLGYELRDIQIIALLFFLYKDKNKGLIEQIYTGEGKSIIITSLSVIKALEGKKVDILTSSCVLAERDSREMKKFYNLFGLSVDYCKTNNDKELRENEIENFKCYNADIVYGDCLSLEGDILRTNFMGIVGRGNNRAFNCIIIDEIDNICLDNIKNTTELLDNFHGYKFLEYIYLYIFNKLMEIEQEIKQKCSKENLKNYDDYKSYIYKNRNEIIEKLIKYSKEELLDFQKLSSKNIIIPEHLKNFVSIRLMKWCESAYDAKYIYKENREYIISKDIEYGFKTIKPVDFSNTGVVQENSVWTGLHQFLEIKEGLRLTEENINSCYMSNLTFFKKYISDSENNIYGLTGTLGTNKTQKALQILYNLNIIFIPSFKERKFECLPPKITNDLKNYKDILINEIRDIVMNQKRAVLVIFKYIEEVIEVYNILLKYGFPKENIIKYTRNDINEQKRFLNYEINCGQIILSTNLSGRGTDIKISKNLETKNGLHVILTFIPSSKRIEDQAFGRAGRKGEKGSGQYILYSDKSFELLIKERDIREEKEFSFLIEVYQKKIDLFAEIFKDFSNFLNTIKEDETILLDIRERWALFLVENELTDIEKEYKNEKSLQIDINKLNSVKKNYNKFKELIKHDIQGKYHYFNPLILSKTKLVSNCNEAIERDPILSLGAYLFRSFENINNKIDDYKKIAFSDSQKLGNNLKFLEKQFLLYKKMMDELKINRNSDLYKQNNEKIEFIKEFYNIINKNTLIIESNLTKKEYDLKAKRIFINNLNIKERYSKDILEYFKDYGGICLFDLEEYKKNIFSRCLQKLNYF